MGFVPADAVRRPGATASRRGYRDLIAATISGGQVPRRILLRGALATAGTRLLAGCGGPPLPVVELALAAVPGNGYVVGLVVDVLHRAAFQSGARIRVTWAADWRSWVTDSAAPLPDVLLTAAPGILPPLAERLTDLSPLLTSITSTGDGIPSQPWRLPVAGTGSALVALPLLYDPVLVLAPKGMDTGANGHGYGFLGPDGIVQRKGVRVGLWDWAGFVGAVARYINAHLGGGGVDVGLPDTGPALSMWLAAGWGDALAGPGSGGVWQARFAENAAPPVLESWQIPTAAHRPQSGMAALLTLLSMGGQPPRLRFSHASTAAGNGTKAGNPLAAGTEWTLAPLPQLAGRPPARYLSASVPAGARPQATAMVGALLGNRLQLQMAQSGWGLPARVTAFLQWAEGPYDCMWTPFRYGPHAGMGYHWVCDPLPVATPTLCLDPASVFGQRTAANAERYTLIQRNLLAALGALPTTSAAQRVAVLTAAQAAANAGQPWGAGGGGGVPPGVALPGF